MESSKRTVSIVLDRTAETVVDGRSLIVLCTQHTIKSGYGSSDR